MFTRTKQNHQCLKLFKGWLSKLINIVIDIISIIVRIK